MYSTYHLELEIQESFRMFRILDYQWNLKILVLMRTTKILVLSLPVSEILVGAVPIANSFNHSGRWHQYRIRKYLGHRCRHHCHQHRDHGGEVTPRPQWLPSFKGPSRREGKWPSCRMLASTCETSTGDARKLLCVGGWGFPERFGIKGDDQNPIKKF